jgi:hypothetical protein
LAILLMKPDYIIYGERGDFPFGKRRNNSGRQAGEPWTKKSLFVLGHIIE